MNSNLDFIEQKGLGSGFVYKSTTAAYYFNGASFTQITDVDFPATTVRGLVFLDGTYYVMTPDAAIYGSDLNNPTQWSALNVIQSQSEPDGGVCLARQLNLVVAFNDYSTEFFYDAANPTGSPLSPYTSSFLEVGCASAGSVTMAENQLIFMSQGRQKGRQIQILKGTIPTPISNSFVDRILNKDTLSQVLAFYIKLSGHAFYLLTLVDSGITLAYDFASGQWATWTQLVKNTIGYTVTNVTWSNGVASITIPGHLVSDGDLVEFTGLPTGYNGTHVVNYVDANTISFESALGGTFVSGGVAQLYNETYFQMSSYTKSDSFDLVQDSTTGIVYSISTDSYQDGSTPIKYRIRTTNFDGETSDMKFFERLELIGDKLAGTAYVRYTNNDYQTWSNYRPLDLSLPRSNINRLGRARRRAFEMINYDNKPIRLNNMDLTVKKGFI